jgi:hypothetical protein
VRVLWRASEKRELANVTGQPLNGSQIGPADKLIDAGERVLSRAIAAVRSAPKGHLRCLALCCLNQVCMPVLHLFAPAKDVPSRGRHYRRNAILIAQLIVMQKLLPSLFAA